MIKPKNFIAPWIDVAEITRVVESVRAKYPVCRIIPVDVLVLAEFDLNLNFEFKPIADLGQDACLLQDFSGIVFDVDAFDARNANRVRFSVAHELGHLYLHRDLYGKVAFETVQEWIDFIDHVSADQYQRIEWQADEFAGQLLMPPRELAAALDETVADAAREGVLPLGPDVVLDFCCQAMHRDFGVSRQAMGTRLRRSKLWPHRNVPGAGPTGL